MTIRDLWVSLWDFLVRRSRLYERGARHDLERSRERNRQRAEEWSDSIPLKDIANHSKVVAERIAKLRRRYIYLAAQVDKLFKGILPDPLANSFGRRDLQHCSDQTETYLLRSHHIKRLC